MAVLSLQGAELIELITQLSKTPDGFTPAAGQQLAVHPSLPAIRCARLVKQGLLHRGKVQRVVHFFSTKSAAAAWEARTPYKDPARKTIRDAHLAKKLDLRALIAEQAATENGFLCAEATMTTLGTAYKECLRQVKAGKLWKAHRGKSKVHYFDTQARADSYQKAHITLEKQKALLPAIVSKPMPVIERKPYVVPVKRVVQIIYPAGYKHSYYPMPAPRNQVLSLPFVHGGMRAMA